MDHLSTHRNRPSGLDDVSLTFCLFFLSFNSFPQLNVLQARRDMNHDGFAAKISILQPPRSASPERPFQGSGEREVWMPSAQWLLRAKDTLHVIFQGSVQKEGIFF